MNSFLQRQHNTKLSESSTSFRHNRSNNFISNNV